MLACWHAIRFPQVRPLLVRIHRTEFILRYEKIIHPFASFSHIFVLVCGPNWWAGKRVRVIRQADEPAIGRAEGWTGELAFEWTYMVWFAGARIEA